MNLVNYSGIYRMKRIIGLLRALAGCRDDETLL